MCVPSSFIAASECDSGLCFAFTEARVAPGRLVGRSEDCPEHISVLVHPLQPAGGVAIARPAGQCQLRSPQWPSVLSSRREGPFVSSLLTSPLDEGLACRPGGPATPRRRICLAPLSPVLWSMTATSHMWLVPPPECGWCVTEEVNFSFT